MAHQALVEEAMEAWCRLTVAMNRGKEVLIEELGDEYKNQFVHDFVLVGDVLVALQGEQIVKDLETLAEDRAPEVERDLSRCAICGDKLNPNYVHAGLDECDICCSAWAVPV